jgi:Uma2 family endonuclease
MATATITTGAQFDALPYEEGRKWELLDGELVPVASPTWRHQEIAFEINSALRRYIKTAGVQARAAQDVEFALTPDDRVCPDVCVLLAEKAARLDRDRIPIPGAPDIAVEIISPSESATESHEKVRTYLRNGTSEVWQIYPKSRTIQIHFGSVSREIEADGNVTTELLPGFEMPVASLFE